MEQKVESLFNIHLHGHTHDQWLTASEGHLRISAGACYTGSVRENAYSWTSINFRDQRAVVYLREYKRKGAGGWGAMEIPGKTTEAGLYETQSLFRRDLRIENSVVSLPGSGVPLISEAGSVGALIRVFEEYFSLRWEPGTFANSENPVVVYWPVRLRQATPIHAFQSFVASALQKKGARVRLYLDDLGNADAKPEEFLAKVRKWFGLLDVQFDLDANVSLFSQFITEEKAWGTWEMVRKWLAENQYKLDKVLEVSKLTAAGEDLTLEKLLQRRPRRLLTPSLVWACLSYLLSESGDSNVITLGGYDERILWKTWREGIRGPTSKVGHLYVPVLQEPTSGGQGKQAMHMSKRDLAWDSREDIAEALQEDRLAEPGAKNWLEKGRMAEWCLRGLVLLPPYIKGGPAEWSATGQVVTPVEGTRELERLDAEVLIASLARATADWIL
jgi:hypothetical protein